MAEVNTKYTNTQNTMATCIYNIYIYYYRYMVRFLQPLRGKCQYTPFLKLPSSGYFCHGKLRLLLESYYKDILIIFSPRNAESYNNNRSYRSKSVKKTMTNYFLAFSFYARSIAGNGKTKLLHTSFSSK